MYTIYKKINISILRVHAQKFFTDEVRNQKSLETTGLDN